MKSEHIPEPVHFERMPGHLIRRLHQVQVALFAQAAGDIDLPPVQFAALAYAQAHPLTDQASLARAIAYDPVTIGGVLTRLEFKAWIERVPSPTDKRARLVRATPAGEHVLAQMHQRVEKAQTELLQPFNAQQKVLFMDLLQTLLKAHRFTPES
jgi:DNA-binding MarR family transcriptional regulator